MAAIKSIALVLLSALTIVTANVATAQDIPAPPSNLCIDNNCPGIAMKWHPGHYMQIRRDDPDTVQATRFKYYDQIATNSRIEGVNVFFRWSQLEGPTRGDYSAGIALVRAEINKLKSLAVPKRLVITVMDQYFKGNMENYAKFFPKYLYDNDKLIMTSDGSRLLWTKWDPTAMGWFIDMTNAYAAEFDNEPYVEAIRVGQETTISGAGPQADYDTQMRRLALALSRAWRTTNVWIPTNWGLTGTRMENYIAYLSSIGVGGGNPDTCPSCSMPVDLMLRGEQGGVDYRGNTALFFAVECSQLGYNAVGPDGGFTAQQIYDYLEHVQRANYIFWDRNVVIGTPEQRWETGILPVINSQPVTNIACPKSYSACNVR